MKRKKAALYDPYLDTLGGGERHILSIMKILEEEGYEITIFWDEDFTDKVKSSLNLEFKNLSFKPNIFKTSSAFQKYKELSNFDIFFYVTDGSYFFSGAKKNFIFSMVPNPALYKMSFMNKLKTRNQKFISNSQYTKNLLEKYGIQSDYIYPYLENTFLNIDVASLKKEKIILSVGRFFKHLHSKRQDAAIKFFQKLKKENELLKDFKLILAGGLLKQDEEYFRELEQLRNDDEDIILKPNIPFIQLLQLYEKSLIYLHCAGYEVDENKNPDLVEHLGITPLEAMCAGCIDICYRAGGLKEIIKDGENGFLFSNYEELNKKMSEVLTMKDSDTIQKNAKKYIKETFSYPVFKTRVKEVVLK
jgi:glycosyltransferase involved in cell wall biosynthesis